MTADITFSVSVYPIRVYNGTTVTTYTVRWRVGHQPWQQSFHSKAQAVSLDSRLRTAARRGEAFDLATGQPASWASKPHQVSWYDFCVAYVDSRWRDAAAGTRKLTARSLAVAMAPMISATSGQPDARQIRVALVQYGFNTKRRASCPPEVAAILTWLSRNTRPVSALADPAVLGAVLHATSTRLDGQPFQATTARGYQTALASAISYGVATGALRGDPLARVNWKRPEVSSVVDRRQVISHNQARRLLTAVGKVQPNGPRLVAFYAVMYYSGLRPEEATDLRRDDVVLPDLVRNPGTGEWEEPADGWGELTVRGAAPEVGRMWTDDGATHEERHLKWRAPGDYRKVPAPPPLVALLRAHLRKFPAGPDGRVFCGFRGGLLSSKVYRGVWHQARQLALSADEHESPLALRVADLRHAAVSTWLSAGVPAAQVAEYAGHTVTVLLKIYAKCISGQDADNRRRVALALGLHDRGGANDAPSEQTG